MRRYLLFGGENYYPHGGWDDLKGSYHSLKLAMNAGKTGGYDWWQVIDTKFMEEVDHKGNVIPKDLDTFDREAQRDGRK